MVIFAILLYIVYAFLKATEDTLNHRFDQSVFSKWNPKFWNPQISWTNKYKFINGVRTNKERFPGSTTLLVWLTDGYHLVQFLQTLVILAGMFVVGVSGDFIGLIVAAFFGGLLRHFSFSKFLIK